MHGEVEYIPSSLIAGFINEQEVRIIKLSPESLVIRISKEVEIHKLKVAFYIFKDNNYIELELEEYEVKSIKRERFCIIYEFIVHNKGYGDNVKRIFKDYLNYINLRVFGCEGEFSYDMVGYPAELDYDYYENYNRELEEWMLELDEDAWDGVDLDGIELAIQIDNYDRYCDFLHMDIEDFKNYYFSKNCISNKVLKHKELTRIYIGNEFCHNLFPDVDLLMNILDKCYRQNIGITICTTYMMEHQVSYYIDVIDRIYNWCICNNYGIDIVINDYGMIELLSDKNDYINIALGNLLNKRKRDPRYKYKRDIIQNPELISQNTLNNDIYIEFLERNNIYKHEYQVCGYIMDIAEGHNSLHMPFYQTNTSQLCPLYAKVTYNNRGQQVSVDNCGRLCKKFYFSYPKHLKMLGRYNSIFAYDETILSNKEIIQEYIHQGIDRIVLNFL